MNIKTKLIVGGIVIAVVSFGGGYEVGHAGASRGATTQARGGFASGLSGGAGGNFARAGNGGATGGNRTFAGFNGGTVISKDAQSLTVKGSDGSSRIVFWSGSTQIMKTASGSADDVAVGDMVTITGTQNSDGSMTAQSIQVRPARVGTTTPAR